MPMMPFLKDRRGRRDSFEDVPFLHDVAGCVHANATHELLDEEKVDFLHFSGYSRWPGKSPDMNHVESVAAIMQERVENAPLDVDSKDFDRDLPLRSTKSVLEDMKNDTTHVQVLAALVSAPFGPCESRWGEGEGISASKDDTVSAFSSSCEKNANLLRPALNLYLQF